MVKTVLYRLCLPTGIILAFFVFFFVLMGFAARGRAQAATAEAELSRASAPREQLAHTQTELKTAEARIHALEAELATVRQQARQAEVKYVDELVTLKFQRSDEVIAMKVQRGEDAMRYTSHLASILAAMRVQTLQGWPTAP